LSLTSGRLRRPATAASRRAPRIQGRRSKYSRQKRRSSRRNEGVMAANSTISARSRKSGRAAPRSGMAFNTSGRLASNTASSWSLYSCLPPKPPPVASLHAASARSSGSRLRLSKHTSQELRAVAVRSRTSRGMPRSAAVRGSMSELMTRQAVDLPEPCSPLATRMGQGGQAAGALGRAAPASGAADHGVHPRPAGPAGDRALASLRAGIQSGRIHLGLLETSRTAQLLSARFRLARLSGAPRPAPHAPTPNPGASLLATSDSVTRICMNE
jgi:hypothetical protein